MPEYSKTKFLKNIVYLMKIKNVKIGELEEAAKVSAGYLSRLSKNNDDNSAPGIDTLTLMAKKLGVTITTLLYCDFTSLTDTEKYIQKFLTKMIEETTKLNGFEWEKETVSAVLNSHNHPLCAENFEGYADSVPYVYNSLFSENVCQLTLPIFKLTHRKNTFYISHIYLNLGNQQTDESYELYMFSNGELKKVCNSNKESKEEIRTLLASLYEAAKASSHNLKLDDDVKDCIDEFLDEDDSDNIDDLPF